MRDDLAVRFRRKNVPPCAAFLFQTVLVFDNAVMHNGEFFVNVRMGVDFGRRAVRRPTRMSDAQMPLDSARRKQFGNAPFFANQL